MHLKKKLLWLIPLIVLICSSVPYLVAWSMTPQGYVYSGLNYNILDSATYLAKMRLGWMGQWRFVLMFTPEPHQGAYLNIYYIFLGHLARLSHIPIIPMYHLARLGGSLALMLALWSLGQQILEPLRAPRWGFWLALVGGGLGWAFPFITENIVDAWVPEAYGFYSMLVNGHFALAQAMMLIIFIMSGRWLLQSERPKGALPLLSLSMLILSLIQPFAIVTIGLSWAYLLLAETIKQRQIPWKTLLPMSVAGASGLIYPLYAVWATQHDPILAGWGAQNINLSPAWWNWAIGYILVFPFAVVGGIQLWKKSHPMHKVVIAWAVATLTAIAIPITVQRRLSLGLSLPLGILAGVGVKYVITRLKHGKIALPGSLLVLTLTTPILLVISGVVGIRTLGLTDLLFVTQDEITAGEKWLGKNTSDSIFLSTARRGQFIPWLTGQRVVVGHPLETLDYLRRGEEAKDFFAGSWNEDQQQAYLCKENVDYIWIGPIERALQNPAASPTPGTTLFFENATVSVYEVNKEKVCSNAP